MSVVFICVVALLPFWFISDPWGGQLPTKAVTNCPAATSAFLKGPASEFALREYSVVAEEIQSRLNQEYLFFGLKLAAVGAILGLLFRTYAVANSSSAAVTTGPLPPTQRMEQNLAAAGIASWVAVMACAMIDVRAQYDIRVIVDLGSWVRVYLEPCFFTSGSASPMHFVGWENYWVTQGFPSTSHIGSWFGFDRRLLTFLMYWAGLVILVVLPRFERARQAFGLNQTNAHWSGLLHISAIAVPIVIVLIGLSEFYVFPASNERDVRFAIIIVLTALLSLVLLLFVARLPDSHIRQANSKRAAAD